MPESKHNSMAQNEGPWRVCSALTLGAVLLMSGFVTYRIFRSQPVFRELFEGFDLQLRNLELMAIAPWFGWILPALALTGVAKELVVHDRKTTLLCNGVHLLVVIVVWQLYEQGVSEPSLELIKSLAGTITA